MATPRRNSWGGNATEGEIELKDDFFRHQVPMNRRSQEIECGFEKLIKVQACGAPWLRGYWQSLKIKKIKETIKYLNIINTFIEIMIQNLSPSCDEVKGLNPATTKFKYIFQLSKNWCYQGFDQGICTVVLVICTKLHGFCTQVFEKNVKKSKLFACFNGFSSSKF